ncbi:MAG TPA: hypothetical protein VNX86_04535 [Rhizomicrobium sp.]|jgi:hypothetical protein|nr:hypothetical protein [Rhizomicrobium sp.]
MATAPEWRNERSQAMRGAAAVSAMIDLIGTTEEDGGEHAVAKILVDEELALRELVKFALMMLAAQR